jgi:hypothetical protein
MQFVQWNKRSGEFEEIFQGPVWLMCEWAGRHSIANRLARSLGSIFFKKFVEVPYKRDYRDYQGPSQTNEKYGLQK